MEGGESLGMNSKDILDICKCSVVGLQSKYPSLKKYMSDVVSGDQTLEAEIGAECALKFLGKDSNDSANKWEFPSSFKEIYMKSCRGGFDKDPEVLEIINELDITAFDICNCSIRKLQEKYTSFKSFISAKNQAQAGGESGKECLFELLDETNKKQPKLWILSDKLKTELYKSCVETKTDEMELINAMGFTTKEFCTCTVNKITERFKSTSDFFSSVGDDSDKRIEKIGEDCMLDFLNSEYTGSNDNGQNTYNYNNSISSNNVTGTGFFISEDNIITNNHVVENCKSINIKINKVKYDARIIASSEKDDLAVIVSDVGLNKFKVAKIRLGRGARVGDDVVVVGYPLGDLLGYGIKATKGNVSSLSGLNKDISQMQITAPVQSGNSGGPLLDSSGNVVGVVTAKLDAMMINEITNDLPQNVNFSIKSSVLKSFLDANDIEYKVSNSNSSLNTSDIVKNAKQYIAKVYCQKN